MAIPHLAIPLRLDGAGAFATVEQDTTDELAQSVAVCLATPIGSRVEVPDYGTPRGDFVGPDIPGTIAAVHEWEPRAELTATAIQGLGDNQEITQLTVLVRPHL